MRKKICIRNNFSFHIYIPINVVKLLLLCVYNVGAADPFTFYHISPNTLPSYTFIQSYFNGWKASRCNQYSVSPTFRIRYAASRRKSIYLSSYFILLYICAVNLTA